MSIYPVFAETDDADMTMEKKTNTTCNLAQLWLLCFLSLQHKARVEAMMCDLASLRSVREFADSFKSKKL